MSISNLKVEELERIIGLETKSEEFKKLRIFIEEKLAERRTAGYIENLRTYDAKKWIEDELFPAIERSFPTVFVKPISKSREHEKAVRHIINGQNRRLKMEEARAADSLKRRMSPTTETSTKKLQTKVKRARKDSFSGFVILDTSSEYSESEPDLRPETHQDHAGYGEYTERESTRAEVRLPIKETNPKVDHRTESVINHDTQHVLSTLALLSNQDSDCVLETYRVRCTKNGIKRKRISKVALFEILQDARADGLLAKYVSFEKWKETVARDLDIEVTELSESRALYILMNDEVWDLVRWNSQSNFRATIMSCFPREYGKRIELEIRDEEQKRDWW